jgi:Ser/Thr protein kinase RdoA (MazF antagonist)
VVTSHLAQVTEAFGWADEVVVSPGPRGALGQIWRLDVGSARYALKETFAGPPSESMIQAELAFAYRATDAGVRVPASIPDRAGRYLIGDRLRLYDWVDMHPVDLTAPDSPRKLGILFARLHRCAPAAAGEPVEPWYDHVSDGREWPELCAMVTRVDPADLKVCHRDLHPENVFADDAGELVVVDWDDLGPATPTRELARALFDWYCDPAPDFNAMRKMYEAYVREGGPGRITELADFSMLVASRLNFLIRQRRIANDPDAEQRHRDWAEREIEEAMRILPTPQQLTDVLELARAL